MFNPPIVIADALSREGKINPIMASETRPGPIILVAGRAVNLLVDPLKCSGPNADIAYDSHTCKMHISTAFKGSAT